MWFFKDYGILGQNARNLNYIKWYNDSIAKKLADSKLSTKSFLEKKGISVVPTIQIIKKYEQISEEFFDSLIPPFVIKPNNGYGGKGIIVIDRIDSVWNFISNSKEVYSRKRLHHHLKEIIDWFFSLSWLRDKVIIEKKIVLDHEIDLLWKYWLPDIRVIVFNMVPVIAMMRVPTEKSDGKANLHAGASWVWIDIATGRLTNITMKSKIVKSIPWIGDVRGIILPKWDEILALAVKVQKVTGLGYLGCDVVLDETIGPLLLEMNARAWLEVQVANLAPLKNRLKRIEGVFVNSVEKGVRIGKDLFWWALELNVRGNDRKVIGEREFISFTYNEKVHQYLSYIKINQEESYIDEDFIKNVLKINDEVIEKWILKMQINIAGEKKTVKFIIKNLGGINIILGNFVLKGYLYDPFKYKKWELPLGSELTWKKLKNIAINKSYKEQLDKIDKTLLTVDKKLNILKAITPFNIEGEKEKFINSGGKYIPKLEYHTSSLDYQKLKNEVEKVDIPDIPLSNIYNKKKQEIIYKINFLESLEQKDDKSLAYYATKLYGEIQEDNLEYAKSMIHSKPKLKEEEEYLSVSEVAEMIKKFNHIYDLQVVFEVGKSASRFTMKGDRLVMREWALVGKREIRSVIAHEIEGHHLRKINGRKLPFSIFAQGTYGYLEIEEGIAIYNQNRFLWEKDQKFYSIFERYFFTYVSKKYSYKKLLEELLKYYNSDYEKVFNYLLRLKRWMQSFSSDFTFTKDIVYLNGLLKVEEYVRQGRDMKELYIWKIAISDLDEIKNSLLIDINLKDIKTPFSL